MLTIGDVLHASTCVLVGAEMDRGALLVVVLGEAHDIGALKFHRVAVRRRR
jgi:hypothetical protein